MSHIPIFCSSLHLLQSGFCLQGAKEAALPQLTNNPLVVKSSWYFWGLPMTLDITNVLSFPGFCYQSSLSWHPPQTLSSCPGLLALTRFWLVYPSHSFLAAWNVSCWLVIAVSLPENDSPLLRTAHAVGPCSCPFLAGRLPSVTGWCADYKARPACLNFQYCEVPPGVLSRIGWYLSCNSFSYWFFSLPILLFLTSLQKHLLWELTNKSAAFNSPSQTLHLREPQLMPKENSSFSPKLPLPTSSHISFHSNASPSSSSQTLGIILEPFTTYQPLTKSYWFNSPKIFKINLLFSIFTTIL